MKFSVERIALLKVLRVMVLVIDPKSVIPALQCVRFIADGQTLAVAGTDLDHALTADILIEPNAAGSVLVDARLLLKVVTTAESEMLEFATIPRDELALSVEIKAGKASWNLTTMDVEKFPIVPTFKAKRTAFKMPFETLRKVLAAVMIARPTFEPSRFALNGVKLEINGSMKAIVTDGHRLALSTTPDITGALDIIIPTKAVKVLQALPSVRDIRIRFDGSRISFAAGEYALHSLPLKGTFPNYEKILPDDSFDRTASFDAVAMTHALKQALATADRYKTFKWKFNADGITEITATDDGRGMFKTEVVSNYKGEEIKFSINVLYLLEFCSKRTGIINMRIKGVDSALYFYVEGLEYVVMPLRYENEV